MFSLARASNFDDTPFEMLVSGRSQARMSKPLMGQSAIDGWLLAING
jgi:hypothetical protein